MFKEGINLTKISLPVGAGAREFVVGAWEPLVQV